MLASILYDMLANMFIGGRPEANFGVALKQVRSWQRHTNIVVRHVGQYVRIVEYDY